MILLVMMMIIIINIIIIIIIINRDREHIEEEVSSVVQELLDIALEIATTESSSSIPEEHLDDE